jgi:hypothetical protein
MGEEVTSLDAANGIRNKFPILLSLLFADPGLQVLDLRQALADKGDDGDVWDAAHPGVADELGVKRKQPFRLFRVAAGGGLPLDQAAGAIE